MTMTSKEALEIIKNWVEYITRLDYVEPIVRGEVKQLLHDAYHKTIPEFTQIEKDLEVLEILKNMDWEIYQNGGGGEWSWFIDTKKSMKLTDEEAQMVREWGIKNERK